MKELRKVTTEVRVQAVEGSASTLTGYVAVFDTPSQMMFDAERGPFIEVIAKGAFAKSIAENDIRALYNHDENRVLGRTKSKTLTLTEDDYGLKFTVVLPDTTDARNLVELVSRGDIDGCSFGFVCRKDVWAIGEDGTLLRTLIDVDVFEVSTGVTFPAYEDTSVALRSMERWKQAEAVEAAEVLDVLRLWVRLAEMSA